MPTFYTYDTYNMEANRSIVVDGSLEDAVPLLQAGFAVYRRQKIWTSAQWVGVFVPRFIPTKGLNLPDEMLMFMDLFRQQDALRPFSQEAVQTFVNECVRRYNTCVQPAYFPANLGVWVPPSADADHALLNHTDRVRLNNWGLQHPSIAVDGTLVDGADPNTIVRNDADRGSFWLARWTYRDAHYFTTLTEPYFEDVTEQLRAYAAERQAPLGEICPDNTSDEEDADYADEPVDRACDAESGDDDDDDDELFGTGRRDGLDFHLYSPEEQTMLPLGHMVSRATEWRYVFSAIQSDFMQVKNLLKVRDNTLRNFHTLLGAYDIRARYAIGARRLLDYIQLRRANVS